MGRLRDQTSDGGFQQPGHWIVPGGGRDILWQLKIPAARISLGYVTNSSERQLLEQESYQKKLAEGIAEAISEVYTNTQ